MLLLSRVLAVGRCKAGGIESTVFSHRPGPGRIIDSICVPRFMLLPARQKVVINMNVNLPVIWRRGGSGTRHTALATQKGEMAGKRGGECGQFLPVARKMLSTRLRPTNRGGCGRVVQSSVGLVRVVTPL